MKKKNGCKWKNMKKTGGEGEAFRCTRCAVPDFKSVALNGVC